jgi:histidinol-phosphatase (PHP family)
MVFARNIRITLSSDAHHPDDLVNEFKTTASLLNEIGFKNLSILMGGKWKQMPFNQHGIIT